MELHIGWPQGIMLVLIVAELCAVSTLHGRPRTQKWDIWTTLVGNILWLALLAWGGFFR
jgi:hypothetical protein